MFIYKRTLQFINQAAEFWKILWPQRICCEYFR